MSQWLIFIVLLAYTDSSASSYSVSSPLKIFPGVAAILLVLLTTAYMLATMQARYWLLAYLADKDKELYTAETMLVRA